MLNLSFLVLLNSIQFLLAFKVCHYYRHTTSINAGFGQAKLPDKSKVPAPEAKCICGSGKSYGDCCKPYHENQGYPGDPVTLVRSRFSALAYGIVPYIMKTTHPKHAEYVAEEQKSKRKSWEKDLNQFCEEFDFVGLTFDREEIDKMQEGDTSKVSFAAKLRKVGTERPPDIMMETSTFSKVDGKWLYLVADVKTPFKGIKGDYVSPQKRAVSTIKKGVPNGN